MPWAALTCCSDATNALAAWLITGAGAVLILIGLFFVAARPPLLPEDARYMGMTVAGITELVPGLSRWLQRVFWVLGGYISATGVLVIYIANTGLREGSPSALPVLAVTGSMSIGWMSVVNFMIRSDFRWALLVLVGLWAAGLVAAFAS